MFPALLDLSILKTAVAGNGSAAARRVQRLDEARARDLKVYSSAPGHDLRAVAGDRLEHRGPREDEVAALHILFTADLPDADARRLAGWARHHGTLINTEDVRPLCDFHVPAVVRRGDLLLTVSTGGKSPGLAACLRRELEKAFGPEWAQHLEELAAVREAWRAGGLPLNEVGRRTDALIAGKGWL